MSSIILADNYDGVVDQVADLLRNLEVAALRTYWTLGDVVAGFLLAQKSGKYPKVSIEQIARDLQEKGYMRDVGNATRYLYWARDIRQKYAADKIETFVQRGITITHVKLLLGVPEALVPEVEARLFREDGKVVSTSDAEELIRDAKRAHSAKEVDAAVRACKAEAQAGYLTAEVDDTPSETSTTGAFTPMTDFGDMFNVPRPAAEVANPPLETPKKSEKPAQAESKKNKEKDKEVSPFKAIKAIDAACEKILANAAEAIIAVDQVAKRGFDSEKAEANYHKQVGMALEGIRSLMKLLPDLELTLAAGQVVEAEPEVQRPVKGKKTK